MGLQLGKDARLKVVDVVAHVKIDVKELFSHFHIWRHISLFVINKTNFV